MYVLCKAGCAGGDEADQEEHQKIHPLAQIEDGRQFNQRSNRAGAQGTIILTAHVLILLRIRKFEILAKHKFQVIHDLVGISLGDRRSLETAKWTLQDKHGSLPWCAG